jgi:hypothetical protein
MISLSEMTPMYDMNFVSSVQLVCVCVCVCGLSVCTRRICTIFEFRLAYLAGLRYREEYWETLMVLSNFFPVALHM